MDLADFMKNLNFLRVLPPPPFPPVFNPDFAGRGSGVGEGELSLELPQTYFSTHMLRSYSRHLKVI